MRLPINPETLHGELESAKAILEKWVDRVGKGLPAIDVPGSEADLEGLLKEMCGELVLIASKCESVSEILQSAEFAE